MARNRYVIGKISYDALDLAQGQRDAAVPSSVQALRNYWTVYYHLRRVTLYDFERHERRRTASRPPVSGRGPVHAMSSRHDRPST